MTRRLFPSAHRSSVTAHAIDWLDQGAGSSVLAQAKQRVALEEQLHALLPCALRAGCRVGQWTEGELTLVMSHTQLASRVRHLLPSLLKGLQRQWPIQSIRLKVQPQAGATAAHPAAVASQPSAAATRLSPAAVTAFSRLKDELPEGPLAQAVQQLIRHHR